MVSEYGIREGYNARADPAYFHDTLNDGAVWQPDVYKYAFRLARCDPRSHFVDFGCGNGDKLVPIFGEMPIIGIDTGTNIQLARQRHGAGARWIDCDLEQFDYTKPIIPSMVKHSVYVTADVIEHIRNPRTLLDHLAQLTNYATTVVISTPDRVRLYGHDHAGPPLNPHHAREWTLSELTGYLRSLGANLRLTGYTRANDVRHEKTTMLIAGGVAEVDFAAIAAQCGIEVVNV